MSIRGWGYALAACLIFGAGYYLADTIRGREIAEMREASALAAQQYQAELTRRETESAGRLADAVDGKQKEIDALGAELSAMRVDIERLRRAASAGGSGVPAPGENSGNACERQVEDCKRLLVEGAELLSEGSSMVGGLSADRNAVRTALEGRK